MSSNSGYTHILDDITDNRIFIFLTVVLVGLVYWDVLAAMAGQWSDDPNYSHGFLVPFISAYLVYLRKEELLKVKPAPANIGLALIVASLLVFVFGVVAVEYYTMRISLVGLIAGIVIFFYGLAVFNALWVPIAFLVFMVPLPYIVYDALAFPLKLFVAKYSVVALKLLGFPVLREGNIIMFPNTVLEVADACSGLRSLMSLLALGVAFALMFLKTRWQMLVLVLSAVPIAILTNGLRVFVTGALSFYWGQEAAEGFFHDFSGFAVFAISFGLLSAVGFGLRRFSNG